MLTLYSWNINGYRACHRKGALQTLVQEHQPDILCLQEIKANTQQLDLTEFTGYSVICNPAIRAGYSGTLILTRHQHLKSILNFPVAITSKYNLLIDSFGDSNQEGRIIVAEFPNFYLVNVYTPNSKGDLSRLQLRHQAWDPAFKQYCSSLDQQKPVLMCGDFNVAHQAIDLARPQANEGKHGYTTEERESFSNLLAAGFTDTFRYLHPEKVTYSWWTHWGNARQNNVGWRIDYWLVSNQLQTKITKAEIHPDITGSDHCPTSLTIDI